MSKKQIDHLIQKYSEIKWITLKIIGGYLVAQNNYSKCLHPFVNGEEKIKVTPKVRLLLNKYYGF